MFATNASNAATTAMRMGQMPDNTQGLSRERYVTGLDLIAWAAQRCADQGIPPTDANILMFIREWK
jgi:hypothetical protein